MSLQNAFQNLAVESKQDAEIAELVAANVSLSSIVSSVGDIDLNTDGLETLVTATNAALTTANGILGDIDTNTDGLEGLSTAANALLTTIDASVSAINANTDGLETLIGTTNTTLASILTSVDQIEGYVDGIEALLGTVVTNTGNTATSTATVATAIKSEDAVAASGDPGIMALGVRNDADAIRTSADGDYTAISTDSAGRVKVVGTITATGTATEATQLNVLAAVDQIEGYVDGIETLIGTTNTNTGTTATNTGTTATNTGTTATNTNTIAGAIKLEDAVAASGDSGIPALGVRNDTAASKTTADGDYSSIATDAAGRVGIADLGGSITVDGTVAVSNPGLTDTQLRATPVPTTETATTDGTQKTQVVDGGGTVLDITATGAALCHLDGKAQLVDAASWTQITDSFVMVGGLVSGGAIAGAAAIRSFTRAWLVDWVDGTGVPYGTTTNPINISGGKLEDDPHTTGDRGLFMLGVRNDADAVRTSADGDYSPISTDSSGRVKIVGTITATGGATETTQLSVLAAVDTVEAVLGTLVHAPTATLSNVSASASSVQLLATTSGRLGGIFFNDSTAIAYVKFGTTASITSFTYRLQPFATLELPSPCHTGRIDAIWASATGTMRITETT